MKHFCPYCAVQTLSSDVRSRIVRWGRFRRNSDSKWVQRYFCFRCKKGFSSGTLNPCYRQKKRGLNSKVEREFCSAVSMRRIARNLNLHQTTVKRKLIFLGCKAQMELLNFNLSLPKAKIVEFDDLETFEHTKCKPLSVTLAVEHKSRRILTFEVSRMPAKGKLSKLALKKYGPRRDERKSARAKVFKSLGPLVLSDATFKSDQNPYYPGDLKRNFPLATHESHKGQRGSIVGQGELKKVRFDPLFSLNHTCAMLRANINRLIRRTWCTTKVPEYLTLHIAIYANFHNKNLINSS